MCCYPNPFITERADPYIVKGPDGFYYFTASYPAFQNADNGYDRIILRKSETVSGLKDATEHTIWKAHEKGEMAKHIWAPELHFIGGLGQQVEYQTIRPKVQGRRPHKRPLGRIGQN